MTRHLEARAQSHAIFANASAAESIAASEKVSGLVRKTIKEGVGAMAQFILSGQLGAGRMTISLDASMLAKELGCRPEQLHPQLLKVDAPFTCRRRGVETKIIAGERKSQPDRAMVGALQKAHRWSDMLKAGTPISEIARTDGVSDGYVRRIIPLATLSPRLQQAIVLGTHPIGLTLEALVRTPLPLRFEDQERLFGLDAATVP